MDEDMLLRCVQLQVLNRHPSIAVTVLERSISERSEDVKIETVIVGYCECPLHKTDSLAAPRQVQPPPLFFSHQEKGVHVEHIS